MEVDCSQNSDTVVPTNIYTPVYKYVCMSKIVCPTCGEIVEKVERGERREPVVRFITDASGTVLTAKEVPTREYTFLPCEHTVNGMKNIDDGSSLVVNTDE